MSYLSTSDYTSRKRVKGQNNTVGLDLEEDVSTDLTGHGICVGITGSWLIGFLSGNPGATDVKEFESYMMTFLRYQGAYIKFAHNISQGDRVNSLMGSMGVGGLATRTELTKLASFKGIFPTADTTWAAHLSIYHHAIGCGHLAGGAYYVMDPNHGLYLYGSHAKMEEVLEDYRAARQTKRNGKPSGCSAWIYRKN